MEKFKWEKDDNGVLHMYVDVAELYRDEEERWRLNSRELGLEYCSIEFDENYNEEEARRCVEGFWNSDDGRRDDF